MKTPASIRTVYTPHGLNFALFLIGLAIVWLSSRNWIAMLGAVVAAIHITVPVDKAKP